MKSIHTLFKSHLSQEILGGLLGMLIAIAIYFLNAGIQFSSVKGLLVDSSAKVSVGSGAVSVNDKKTNPETLKRLAARADQIKKQLAASNSAPAVAVTPVDHTDRTAWIKMRAARRDIAAKFDLAPTHAAAETTGVAARNAVAPSPAPQAGMPAPLSQGTHLPDSGPVLNVVLLLSFACACVLRRDSLIVALRGAR